MKSKTTSSQLALDGIPMPAPRTSAHHRAAKGHPQAAHRFKVGQALHYSPSIFELAARQGIYRVVRLLPADGGDNQYRLKSESDGHERVGQESQLSLE